MKSRDIMKSEPFKEMFPDIKVRRDHDGKTWYKSTDGGERFATSTKGAITGFHAHLIIIDDPLNPKEASSEKERENANNFMDVTLSTRKISKTVTPTILVMQRLHEMDCTGNWLRKREKPVNHICLPGELSKDVKPIELRARYTNGMLDAIRLNQVALTDLKTDLGSYGYSGQIMQTPSPDGGGIWQKWIKPVSRKHIPMDLLHIGTDWDTAYTKNDTNSASAYVTAGITKDKKMYIVDLGYKRLEFPELLTYMKTQIDPHYVEGKASGKSLVQTLRNQGIVATETPVVNGDKIARATLATPYAEAGMVFCEEGVLEKLYHDVDQGILVFPNGAHDDLQDALVQSIHRLLGKRAVFTF